MQDRLVEGGRAGKQSLPVDLFTLHRLTIFIGCNNVYFKLFIVV